MRATLFGLVDRLVAAELPPGVVVEFGAARDPAQAHLPAIADLVAPRPYFGSDQMPTAGISHVHDLHRLGLADGSIGTVIILDTIEHVRRPWEALDEIHRVLAPGGLVIVTSVFFFPVHDYPDDHWRFTASAVGELLRGFDRHHVAAAGPSRMPHTVAGLACREPVDASRWAGWCDALDGWIAHGATSWKERALNVLPPVLLVPAYEGFRRVATRRNRRRPSSLR